LQAIAGLTQNPKKKLLKQQINKSERKFSEKKTMFSTKRSQKFVWGLPGADWP
jgi:hypothetical protein